MIHPVAIKYFFHGDLEPALRSVLDDIERRLSWQPKRKARPVQSGSTGSESRCCVWKELGISVNRKRVRFTSAWSG